MHFWWWKIGHNLPIKKRQNSGFQWELKHLPTAQIWDTPKKEATYTEDRYHRKGYIIMHNNLCFLMFFFFSKGRAVHVEMNLEVVQHWPWMLDTWGLPRIWLALWSDLAGTVQVGIHFRMSTCRWKDSLFSGYTFVHTQIQSTYHTYGLWQQQILEHVPWSCKSSKKTSGAISCQEPEQAPIAYSEFCWRWTLLEGVKHLMQQRYCQTSRLAD